MGFRLSSVSKSYGDRLVFSDLSLEIGRGEILVILGPSGCGKTTLLNLVAGLQKPDSGLVEGFEDIRFSYAFQEPRLLPWLSAWDNALYALSGSSLPRAEQEGRVRFFLEAAGIVESAERLPSELSGGMRQRLSLVRAFSYPADFLLLDEAFQAVDLKTKLELMDVFLELWRKERKSTVLVSHDIEEAVYLGDRIVVLSQRPARILEDFRVSAAREGRRLGSAESLADEARLYDLILSGYQGGPGQRPPGEHPRKKA